VTKPTICPAAGVCPRCVSPWSADDLDAEALRCRKCGLDLAHVETTPSGSIRRVVGWLLSPGDVLQNRYRVNRILGRGGFGATYLVEDLLLERKRRALKEIPDVYFDARETEMLSRLHHPAIPDITDRFATNGLVYLVLEFGGSRTLESVRHEQGGRLPLERVIPWMDQLCDVIGYLHSQEPPIVHRDLKPENILLDESDRVMLIDFGTAKEATSTAATRMLAQSASLGFSPPEQVLGTGTDERSDVYALAATVYVLLTGTLPAAAHERVAGRDLVPANNLVSALPEPVDRAIRQGLELNIQRRQQTIAEFRRALGHGEPPPTRDEPRRTVLITSIPGLGDARASEPRSTSDLRRLELPAPSPTLGGERTGRPERRLVQPRAGIILLVIATGVGLALLGWWRDWSIRSPAEVDQATQGAGPANEPATQQSAAAPQETPASPTADEITPTSVGSATAFANGRSSTTAPGNSATDVFNRLRVPDPEVIPAPQPPTKPAPEDRVRVAERPRTAQARPPITQYARPQEPARGRDEPAPEPSEGWGFERTGERRLY